MPYLVLSTAPSTAKFTGGLHGIAEESTPPCGVAVPVWNMDQPPVMLQENVEAVIRQDDATSSEGIEAKLLELQKELLKLANSKKDYNSVADEIDRLRELKQNALVESAEREGLKQRIKEMREFLEQQSTEVTVYDERFEVEFKSGTKVEIIRFRS